MSKRTYDLGYTKAHREVKKAKGSASQYRCLICSNPAQQWAYDHLDPDELSSPNGAYSRSVDHYWPMCTSCHRAVDTSRLYRRHGYGWESEVCPIAERDGREGDERAWMIQRH